MLIMLIIRYLSVANAYLSGNGLTGPAAQVLATVSGRSAAGPAGPRVSQMFFLHEKLHPAVKFMLAAGAYP